MRGTWLFWLIAWTAAQDNCAAGSDRFCVECDTSARNCTFCVNSYSGADGSCARITSNITNCEQYATASYCRQCSNGYQPYEGGCIPFDSDNCARAVPTNTSLCLYCFNATFPNAQGRCGADTAANRCAVADCAFCSRADACEECREGFVLAADGRSCAASPAGLGDCRRLAAGGGCQRCAFGSFASAGSCLASNDTAIPWKAARLAGILLVSLLALLA